MQHFEQKLGLALIFSLIVAFFSWTSFPHDHMSALYTSLGTLAFFLVAFFFGPPLYAVLRDHKEDLHKRTTMKQEHRTKTQELQMRQQELALQREKLQQDAALRTMELALQQSRAEVERMTAMIEAQVKQGQFHLEQQRFVVEQVSGPVARLSSNEWLYHLASDRVIGPPRSSGHTEITAPSITVQKEPLPGPCRLVDVIKPIDLSPETIFLALARGDRPIMCSLEGLMHVAKDSPTGQGKTSLSYAEMVMLLWMQTQIIIANPHFIPVDKKGRDWRPIGRAIEQQGWIEVAPKRWLPGLVRRPEHIATLMCWLATQEIDRRFTMQEQGDFSYKPLYLFIDEWPMIVRKCPEVADYQIEILQRGRAVDVCVDTNSQGFLVSDTALSGSARENFNTAYHMGGNPRSASTLLDMPVADINKLLKDTTLGKGVALLRNNEACPQAELVRLPYADNDFAYYLLGKANDWSIPALPIEETVEEMQEDIELHPPHERHPLTDARPFERRNTDTLRFHEGYSVRSSQPPIEPMSAPHETPHDPSHEPQVSGEALMRGVCQRDYDLIVTTAKNILAATGQTKISKGDLLKRLRELDGNRWNDNRRVTLRAVLEHANIPQL